MNVDRRKFLGIGLGGAAALVNSASAVDAPYSRKAAPQLIPALAAYSFKDHFTYIKNKPNKNVTKGKEMDMIQFINYCAEQKVAAELTSYFFHPEADATYFVDCRKQAHLNGVAIAGTAVGNQFTLDPSSDAAKSQMDYVKKWIDRSVLMGAPHVRVFAGKIPKGMPEAEAEKNATAALAAAGKYAASKGIFLGIENHDSIGSAKKLLKIVRDVKNPWVGVNLDSGNFRTEDPYHDFAECVPYAVNVQLKVEIKVGDTKEPADMERFFKLLRAGNYSGHVVLEYEEKENPFEKIPPLLTTIKQLSKP